MKLGVYFEMNTKRKKDYTELTKSMEGMGFERLGDNFYISRRFDKEDNSIILTFAERVGIVKNLCKEFILFEIDDFRDFKMFLHNKK